MGGSSKKQTIGYRYMLGLHAVFTHGPVDKVTRIFFDDTRSAWQGSAVSGDTIVIDQPNLFGGDDREGGVGGNVDVMLGEPTQGVNAYLSGQLGALTPAFRRVSSLVFRGGFLKNIVLPILGSTAFSYGSGFYFGNNPYLKTFGARMQRINVTTDGNTQWYPEKAAIFSYVEDVTLPPVDGYWEVEAGFYYTLQDNVTNYGTVTTAYVATADQIGQNAIAARNAATGSSYVWAGSQLTTLDGHPAIVAWEAGHGPSVGIAVIRATPVCPAGYVVSYKEGSDASGSVGFDSPLVVCNLTTNSVFDMNPAHIIRECLIDPDWGMGYQATDVDDASFTAAADTLFAERMGISLLWDKQIPIEDFVKEIVRHIDAVLYVDRKTGQFTLKLIRNDYSVASLITLNEDNIDKVADFKRAAFGELVNSVTVNYWDSATGTDASLTVQDIALAQMQGATINTTLQYPGFTNHDVASRAAQRDLTTLSTPLVSCTIYANRDAKDLTIGSVFVWEWPDYQIASVVMRVTGVAYGNGRNNQIRLTCVQDVFSLPESIFQSETPSAWQDPNGDVVALTKRLPIELPYLELVQRQGQAAVDSAISTDSNIGYVGIAAGREGSAVNALMLTDSGGGYNDVGYMDFSPYVVLDQNIGRTETRFAVKNATDISLIDSETLMQFGSELMAFISLSGNQLTVKRGVLDTVPTAHTAGEVGFLWDNYLEADSTEYVNSDSVNIKLLTSNGTTKLLESAAPVDNVAVVGRAAKPYAPGNFAINGTVFAYVFSGDCALTWSHRDRKQQTSGTFLNYTDGNVGPESGVTYTLDIYGDAGTILRTVTGITAAGYTYTQTLENADMGGGSGGDSNWSNVVSLLHLDGANNSTTITDQTGKTWTASGTCKISTTQSKFGGASCVFDGTSFCYATTPNGTDFQFGSGDFTIEAWIYPNANTGHVIAANWRGVNATDCAWIFYLTSGKLQLSYGVGSTNTGTASATGVSNSVWTHVVVQRRGTAIEYYINGVKDANSATLTSGAVLNYYAGEPVAIGALQISSTSGGSTRFNGYIDDFRITKGVARYTSNFTPPTAAYPNSAGTSLNNALRFVLKAIRSGIESFTKYDWTVKRSGYGTATGYGNYYGSNYGS